jgi:hypothetical protein
MDALTLRFTTKWPLNVASYLIARGTGSKMCSHVMLIREGMAYEATMLHGCRKVPLDVAMDGVAKYQDMALAVPDLETGLAWIEEQMGKAYDYAALLLPVLASDDWADDSKWWCSELVFMCLLKAGLVLLDPDIVKRVTPEDLRMCNHPKSEIFNLRQPA